MEKSINKVNPLEVVVQKFAELGWDPEGAFDLLDDDGDGALTMTEIKDGMAKCKINLKQDEWDLFYKTIDANSDGVLTCEEWVGILEPKVSA
jgi:Ca2+-binding EF-hand superfamily protein